MPAPPDKGSFEELAMALDLDDDDDLVCPEAVEEVEEERRASDRDLNALQVWVRM